MGTWSTAANVEATPERILHVLTEPAACARWSPVRFVLDGLTTPRLMTGTRGRLGGRLIGRRVEFDLEILHADCGRFELRAHGPVRIDAVYHVQPAGTVTQLQAAVSVSPGPGLTGRFAARAADALLAAGVLDQAVERIAGEVELAEAA
jgi:hypothetical protein